MYINCNNTRHLHVRLNANSVDDDDDGGDTSAFVHHDEILALHC